MSNLSNKEICHAVKNIASIRREIRERKGVIKRTERRLRALERRLRAAEEVDVIHQGVPLKIYGETHIYIYSVSDKIRRYACVYRNANNPKRWGLSLRAYLYEEEAQGIPYGGEWMGADWKRQKDVMEAAKDWVATGKKP
jgi:hypothetical protein